MAQDREAQTTLAAFYKFVTVGQAVAGYVAKASQNDNGEFIVLRPALVRNSRDERYEKTAEIAVGLTTDLGMKIDTKRDVGRFILIVFDDTEASRRGQPKKIFRVIELTQAEIISLRDGNFTLPEAPPRKTPDAVADATNDLF